ncbi:hypothetical protein HPB51_022491 [Rhipicephalus microplus]|uniref:Metalloendopeptidase n=1 Tax=Rhipicephalus microplus TaxID=6941 RepID=A0A9J6ECD8_RHIMP|nr:hypothetical protein HPB51_022491 [Rhipicephalus microplus]
MEALYQQSVLFDRQVNDASSPEFSATLGDNSIEWIREIVRSVVREETAKCTWGETAGDRTTKKILKTMADIESETCLRFVARRKQKNYVLITRREGCSSFVGRQGGVQEVSLGTHCLYTGLIAHELLHAVGFDHEHSRSDRDEYIDVFMENVEPENTEQFEKLAPSKNRLLTPFDMDSIMLYGSETFAREPGLVTMLAKNGSHLKDVFEKPGLSAKAWLTTVGGPQRHVEMMTSGGGHDPSGKTEAVG